MAGSNRSLSEIAAWLKSNHGVSANPKTVQRLLARIAAERKPIAEAVVRSKLQGTLTADLTAAQSLLDNAVRDEDLAREGVLKKGRGKLAIGSAEWGRCMSAADAAAGRRLRALELRFKLSGVSGGGGNESPAELVLRAQRLRQEREAAKDDNE